MPGCPTEAPPLQPGPKPLSEEWRVDGVKPRPFSPGPKPLPEDPCADGERAVRPRDN